MPGFETEIQDEQTKAMLPHWEIIGYAINREKASSQHISITLGGYFSEENYLDDGSAIKKISMYVPYDEPEKPDIYTPLRPQIQEAVNGDIDNAKKLAKKLALFVDAVEK